MARLNTVSSKSFKTSIRCKKYNLFWFFRLIYLLRYYLLWLIRLTNYLKMGWSLRPKRRTLQKINGLVEKIKISCTFYTLSIQSGEISQPSLQKIFKTFSSRTAPYTSISRHSPLEYWAFAQHCLSKVINLVDNK